jgi:hypothetical protein
LDWLKASCKSDIYESKSVDLEKKKGMRNDVFRDIGATIIFKYRRRELMATICEITSERIQAVQMVNGKIQNIVPRRGGRMTAILK